MELQVPMKAPRSNPSESYRLIAEPTLWAGPPSFTECGANCEGAVSSSAEFVHDHEDRDELQEVAWLMNAELTPGLEQSGSSRASSVPSRAGLDHLMHSNSNSADADSEERKPRRVLSQEFINLASALSPLAQEAAHVSTN